MLHNDSTHIGCYAMMVHTSMLHNAVRDFFFRISFSFKVFFTGNLSVQIICVPIRIGKGHFHPVEWCPGHLYYENLSNIMFQEIDSTK